MLKTGHSHVWVSNNLLEGDEENCQNAGMNSYLAKPVKVKQIATCLKEFISDVYFS